MPARYYPLVFLAVGILVAGQNQPSTAADDDLFMRPPEVQVSQAGETPNTDEQGRAPQNLDELELLVESQQRQLREQAARLEQLERIVQGPTHDAELLYEAPQLSNSVPWPTIVTLADS